MCYLVMGLAVKRQLDGTQATFRVTSMLFAAEGATTAGGKDENLHMEVEISLYCAD